MAAARKIDAFTKKVAARTRTAQVILETPQLLAAYEKVGGLKLDLTLIAQAGLRAEAANMGQSMAMAATRGAAGAALVTFDQLREEYSSVMNVVTAVRSDLKREGADRNLLAQIDRIIANEAPVRIVAVDAAKKKTARKVTSLEAVRAEIQKDASALLANKALLPALARRRVDGKRLKALVEGSQALSGMIGEKATKKGASKDATQAERQAVAEQKQAWSGAYRLLAALGRHDARVAQLLKEAAAR